MNNDKVRKYGPFFATGVWLPLISSLTVMKYTPDALNADILMNSVMSLQNITLYYWGQNRLLNVLPLLASPIKTPSTNLAAVLFLTSLSFYSLLLLISHFATRIANLQPSTWIPTKIFFALSAIFIVATDPNGVSEIAFKHIEYSLPALLAGIAVYIVWLKMPGDYRKYVIVFPAILLAIGLNPSTILPLLFIVFAIAVYKKKAGRDEIVVASFSAASFILANYVSSFYGNQPYGEFDIAQLSIGLDRVVAGLTNMANLPALFSLLAIWATWKAIRAAGKKELDRKKCIACEYVTLSILIFSLGWLLLFSSSKWVEMNQFAWRYFIYVVFGLLTITGIWIARFIYEVNAKTSDFLVLAFISVALFSVYTPLPSFKDYKVFQRIDTLVPAGYSLYAGDYWVVWPSVLRDLMQGKQAYGLAYRGEGNRKKAMDFVSSEIDNKGFASILCINDKPENCASQVNFILGSIVVKDAVSIKEGVTEIKFTTGEVTDLDFRGNALSTLPSNTGIIEGDERKSDGASGFLVFGPYVPVKPGSYLLTLYGSSGDTPTSFVDVVSNRGQTAHVRFRIPANTSGMLLDKAPVILPAGIVDLEVRVWTGDDDQLSIHGYTLRKNTGN